MISFKEKCLEAYAVQTAKEGKSLCGDSFYMTANEDYFLCVLADGLGSGEYAYESSQAVASIVESHPSEDVDTLMDYSNQALLHRRGAAVAILKVDFKNKSFQYSCVGNIRFYVYPPNGKLIYPMPVTGYLSGKPQKFRTQTFAYEPNSTFLLHSDGFVNVQTKKLLHNNRSISTVAKFLKETQVDKSDDMTFIVGNLL